MVVLEKFFIKSLRVTVVFLLRLFIWLLVLFIVRRYSFILFIHSTLRIRSFIISLSLFGFMPAYVVSLRVKGFRETFMVKVFVYNIMHIVEFFVQDVQNVFVWRYCDEFEVWLNVGKLKMRQVYLELSSNFFKLVSQILIFLLAVCSSSKLFFYFFVIHLDVLFKPQSGLNYAWKFGASKSWDNKLHDREREVFFVILFNSFKRKWM